MSGALTRVFWRVWCTCRCDICIDVITKLIPELVAGKRVVELCTLGDQLIDAGVAGIYNNPKRKVDSKGVAFPTCISINNCVGHFSPLKDDTTVLKDGDVVKMYVSSALHFLTALFLFHRFNGIGFNSKSRRNGTQAQ